MRLSTSLIVLAVTLSASAAPIRRADTTVSPNDLLVFQFADVLEQLESGFYSQALSTFQSSDFTDAGFTSAQIPVQIFTGIQNDESTHDSFLQDALAAIGGAPITGCNFDFSSVLTDVATMAATARVVENVGVGAYLGGATLISDPELLDAAASILTVEARHQTMLNVLNLGSAIPQSFDIALAPSEVLAIAGGFVSGCNIPIPANPSLTITNSGPLAPGDQLTFSSPAINGSTDGLFCQMMLGGQPAAIPMPFDQCVVPQGINGPVAIFITSDGQPLVNNVVDRATVQLVAGPAMTFVDTQPQMLGMLVNSGINSNSSSNSTSTASAATSFTTQTISPAEAQSIISAAGATQTAAPAAPPSSSSTPGSGALGSGPSAVSINAWTTVTAIPTPAP
jgi:hypothetical protein